MNIQWKKIHIWTRQPPSHTNAHREQQSQTDSDTQKNPQTKMKKKKSKQTTKKEREKNHKLIRQAMKREGMGSES